MSAAAKTPSERELHLDRGRRAFPCQRVNDRDGPEQNSGRVDEHEERGERDPPAGGALGSTRDLLRDDPGQADRVGDHVRLDAHRAGQQSEARDDEERERQDEHEQPVGERPGKHAAADVGVSLDRLERGIERRRSFAGLFDPASERLRLLDPQRQALGQCPPWRRQLHLRRPVMREDTAAAQGSTRAFSAAARGASRRCFSLCRQLAQTGREDRTDQRHRDHDEDVADHRDHDAEGAERLPVRVQRSRHEKRRGGGCAAEDNGGEQRAG